MIILEESPWYQEILSRGEQKRLVRTLLDILERRFGTVLPDVATQLTTLDLLRLENLVGPAITLPSLEEFLQVLEQQTAPEESNNAT